MTDTAASAPADGPLSVDQAIATLIPETAQEVETAAPEEAVVEQETEGDASAPEVAEDGDESPAEETEAEAETEAVEPVDPPKYWSKDAKEAFAKLPADLQAVVLEQEGPREEAAAKAKSEAAELSKQAQAEVAKVMQFSEQLSQFLPQAVETFKSKWDGVDWKATAEAYGAEEAFKMKVEMEAEQAQLQQLIAAQQQANKIAAEKARQEDQKRLQELAPHLAEPAKRAEVLKYAAEATGFDEKALEGASAIELMFIEKAMKWDRAQASLAAKPKATPAPIKAPVKPAAKAPSPAIRQADTAKNRFAQTRSVDDAVAWLVSRG